jgi:formate hydrogenlyase subunit 6/NADH:ubiquinone oxidoreductase subunit I
MPYFITDKCIGCTLCEAKCPTDTISGLKRELFTIHPEGCIECGVCAIYCPVSAITNQFGEIVQGKKLKEIPKAVVDPDNCTACEFCIDICPFDCITLQPDPRNPEMHYKVAVVNEKTCVSCRLCEIVCDKDAIYVPDPITNLAPMMPQHIKKDPRSAHQVSSEHQEPEFYRNETGPRFMGKP